MSAWYLDSSAIVKLTVVERETRALRRWHRTLDPEDVLFTCELAITEVLRAVSRVGGDTDTAITHLDTLDQLVIDRDLLIDAARLAPRSVRTLDAIHLAAARTAEDDLGAVVTYDDRMIDAARALGLATTAPGRGGLRG